MNFFGYLLKFSYIFQSCPYSLYALLWLWTWRRSMDAISIAFSSEHKALTLPCATLMSAFYVTSWVCRCTPTIVNYIIIWPNSYCMHYTVSVIISKFYQLIDQCLGTRHFKSIPIESILMGYSFSYFANIIYISQLLARLALAALLTANNVSQMVLRMCICDNAIFICILWFLIVYRILHIVAK